MPIYEYQCQQCGERFEVLQRLSDDPLTRCEMCSGELKKLISAPAFQFKGSGWYVTDYARKDGGGKDGGSEGGKSTSSSASSGSSSSDSSSSSGSSDSGKSGSSDKGGSSSKSSASSDA